MKFNEKGFKNIICLKKLKFRFLRINATTKDTVKV